MKKYLAHCPWIGVLLIIILNAIYIPNHAMAQSGLGAASVGRGGISLGSLDPLWALRNDLSGLKLPQTPHTDSLLTHDRGSTSRTQTQDQWRWQGLALMVQRSYGLAELDERLMSTVWVTSAIQINLRRRGASECMIRVMRFSGPHSSRLGWAKSTPKWSLGLASVNPQSNHANKLLRTASD